MNHLYYGDNLDVLRASIADESVDLIYLDPPFNSKRDYNLLFKSPKGHESEAQIEAFEDTWHWNHQSEREFEELLQQHNTDVSALMQALRSFLGENDLMAYLTLMANRLLELHRVLKPTGSLYLHCDPTASHYLKIVLDGVFGKEQFTNEIIWQRAGAKAHTFTRYPSTHDVILFYEKGENEATWNGQYLTHREEYLESHYSNVEPDTGRHFTPGDLLNPNKDRPNLTYEFPPDSGSVRVWRWTKVRMMEAWNEGRIVVPEKGGVPRFKRYLDEMKGTPVTSVWTDIPPINSQAQERLGYPTQKPLALLERILLASSNAGDVVLDPFCGCGTAVHAAQKLGRQWIGIDITHLAISLIEKRLKDAFYDKAKSPEEQTLQFAVHGTPKDLEGARHLAQLSEHDGRYQFQWWAVSLVEAQPFQGKKKGADKGIDGIKYFHDADGKGARKAIVSVKSGKIKADDVRSLMAVRERESAEFGILISLEEPSAGMTKDAASAGFYTSAMGKKIPRIQLRTIEGLMNGTQRAEHPDAAPVNFKKAAKEASSVQETLL